MELFKIRFIFGYLLTCCVFCYNEEMKSDVDQCLLIILLDGIRWDYVDDKSLKGFPKLARNGVKAEFVKPIFPSNSYPNWYSITTGLYAENHGIVDNFMYDEKHDDYFLMAPDRGVFKEHWWNDAEPLWITAEKNSIKTFMYNWVGCEIPIRGIKASYCKSFRSLSFWPRVNRDTKAALFNALDHFQSNTSRLGFVYYEPVDAIGHQFGPNSYLTRNFLRRIDLILDDLQEEIRKRNLENKVNVVVVSDHGMTTKTIFNTRTISLDDIISANDVKVMLNVHYNTMIWPIEGKEEKVYLSLKKANKPGLHVYKKEEFPNKYHFSHHRLIAPIILTASKKYNILPLRNSAKVKPYYPIAFITTYLQPGLHGLDPFSEESDDMRTIFFASGPSFKKGYVSPPLEMVDHYNIFCHVLGIKPLSNNGSFDRIKDFLVTKKYII